MNIVPCFFTFIAEIDPYSLLHIKIFFINYVRITVINHNARHHTYICIRNQNKMGKSTTINYVL